MKGRTTPLLSMVAIITFAALAMVPVATFSQTDTPDQQARTVNAETRSAIIEKVVQQLNEYYIDPDVAKKMEELLRLKLSEGEYDRFVEQKPFLRQLTEDLHTVSHDLHLGVWPIEWALSGEDLSDEDKARLAARARYDNFGFMKVDRLPGNIGYLEMSYFEEIDQGGETAVAAMNLLANSDALIIDVRRNGGGSDVVSLVVSYFFKEPVHRMDSYSKITGKTEQHWTMAYLPGPRLDKIPVYVLISHRSASAAEGLAYTIKTLGRGTLVGELTRGAANPIEEFVFPELEICMAVSAYRVSSPITGTCWEGVGIEPDIKVPAEKALDAACVEAMKKLLESEAGEEVTKFRRWALEMYKALLNPITLAPEELEKYKGKYGSSYSIAGAGGTLVLLHEYRMPITLIPLGNDEFAFREEEGKARFVRDDAGVVAGLEIMFADGYQSSLKKTTE
jgi:hypothetical protein